MKFTYKNKTVDVIFKEENFFLNEENLLSHKIYFVPATLTTEFAYVAVVLNDESMRKKYGECIFLKSSSWLKKQTDEENDTEIVEELNHNIKSYLKTNDLNIKVEAIPGSKMEQDDVFIVDNQALCPMLNFYFNFKNVDVIFYERLTSYTKTFDITFVMKNKKRVSLSLVDRKQYLSVMDNYFEENKIEVVKTGPDPVDWNDAYERHFQYKLDWKQVYMIESETEDDDDEWQAGSTETDEDDYIYSSEEEEVPVIPLEKKRKLDEEWETKSKVLNCDDYDNWEKKQKV
jgi:hypothetical protein